MELKTVDSIAGNGTVVNSFKILITDSGITFSANSDRKQMNNTVSVLFIIFLNVTSGHRQSGLHRFLLLSVNCHAYLGKIKERFPVAFSKV